MLCERGIRTFETAYRFTLDLMAVPVLQAALAPAGGRRSEPRRRAPRPRRAAVAGGRRGGRRRDHRRGAPQPRGGDLRRPAGAARRRVRGLRGGGRARGGGRRQGVRRTRERRRRRGRADRRLDRAGGARAPGRDRDRLRPRRAASARRRSSAARSSVAAERRGGRRRRRARVRRRAGRRARPARSTRCSPPRRRDCAVTDVGSTKRAIVAGRGDPRFIGGHPLAGAETSGVEHARADLFDGATWYLTPGPATDGVLYERLHRALARDRRAADGDRRRASTTA